MALSGRVEAHFTTPTVVSVNVTNSGGGPTGVGILPGTFYMTAAGGVSGLLSSLESSLNAIQPPSAGAWTISLSSTTGQVTIDCVGTWSLVWTSTTLRDFLGFAGDISSVASPQTGTNAAKGVWCPDAAMDVGQSDPRRAPRITDLRTTQSPTGRVLGLTGTGFYRHSNVSWPLVPQNRVWERAAEYTNGSWETFVKETQFGEGSWFDVSSPVQIYDHNGNLIGGDANDGTGVAGWSITGLNSVEPKRFQNFTGLWSILLPEIVSSG